MKISNRRKNLITEPIPPEETSNKTLRWVILLIFITALVWFFYAYQGVAPQPPSGVLVAQNPIQNNVSPMQFRTKDYTITAQASLQITGRVLGKHYYTSDREADLSPADLALGWGYMSDSAYLKKVEISQSNRWYYWEPTGDLPLDNNYIIRHSANVHIVPGNDRIIESIKAIKVNNIIQMQGYLINVKAPDGYRWNTSLTREDTGDHSCEILLVTDLKILNPPTAK